MPTPGATALNDTGAVAVVVYDAGSNTWKYNNGGTKTFVIDHPDNEDEYLVHACLEGPEAGVYYRGEGRILNNKSVTIELPSYVSSLAKKFTVQVTPLVLTDDEDEDNLCCNKCYAASKVRDNKFTVYGKNGEFYWHVHGERSSIEIEPKKSETIVRGEGPYKYIS
jgi:hypothetical protein